MPQLAGAFIYYPLSLSKSYLKSSLAVCLRLHSGNKFSLATCLSKHFLGIIHQVIVGGVSIHFVKKWREVFALPKRIFSVSCNKNVLAFVIKDVEPYGLIAT